MCFQTETTLKLKRFYESNIKTVIEKFYKNRITLPELQAYSMDIASARTPPKETVMADRISPTFYRPQLLTNIRQFCRNCKTCQRY